MRRALIRAVLVALALHLVPLPPSAHAQDTAETIQKLEQGLATAVRTKDRRSLGNYLAAKFAWTDAQGNSWPKSEVLKSIAEFPAVAESDVKINMYGAMATVIGQRGHVRFVRIWVKRALGWRLFLLLDTPGPAQASAPTQASVEPGAGEVDCNNPCRTLPYTPRGDMDQAIVAAWQQNKLNEWKPNADAWARNIADEFVFVSNTTLRNREQRLAVIKSAQERNVGLPGDPVTFMRITDFSPDSAVMVSRHAPSRGGKPYFAVRVWVNREARWQLALSQQVTIQAAQPVPAAATAKR
jgi:hypothetical protein